MSTDGTQTELTKTVGKAKGQNQKDEEQVSVKGLQKIVEGLAEQIVQLKGELEAAHIQDRIILERQERINAIVERQEARRRSAGPHRFYLFDTREKDKRPVEFYSSQPNPKTALREYQERTGMRFVGQGSDPFIVRTEPVLADN